MHKFLALLILTLVVGCNNSQNLDNTNYDDPALPESGGVLDQCNDWRTKQPDCNDSW